MQVRGGGPGGAEPGPVPEGFAAAARSPAATAPEPDAPARGVLTLAQHVLGELDVDVVLQRTLESARELTGAQHAAVGVLDDRRRQLSRFLTSGLDDEHARRLGEPPTGRGVLGELILRPEPLRIADVGTHPHSYGFPCGHPPMTSFLGVPLLIAGEPYGNLYLTNKRDGAGFTEEDERALVLLAQFAALAIDHARRYTGSEQRGHGLQRTVEALETTIQIARALGGQTDLPAILALVAKRGRALVAARALVIELKQAGEAVIAAAAGRVPEEVVGQRVALADALAAGALRTGTVERLGGELAPGPLERQLLGRFGLTARAALAVPLVFRNEVHGALVAIDRLDGSPFGAEDERLLDAFAASAAAAVATARSAADERRRQRLAATEAERGRWARELHDESLQGLAGLRLGLSAALRAGGPEAMERAIRQAIGRVEVEIAGLRGLVTDLRPAALDTGTEAAVRALAERVRSAGLDVQVTVALSGEQGRAGGRYDPELETAMYRIVQEALANASKHGHARRAVVEVLQDEESVRVSVRDDGDGFDPESATDGFGLLGMRERAQLLGGTIAIESMLMHGTAVCAVFPARRQDGRDTLTDPDALASRPSGSVGV